MCWTGKKFMVMAEEDDKKEEEKFQLDAAGEVPLPGNNRRYQNRSW
jgi:hypothetical protein